MGLKPRNPPPHIKEMEKFEAEMIGMVKEIKFRKMRNNIQQKMYEDMRKFKESGKIFVKSEKLILYIYIYIYIPNPSARAGCDKVNFSAEFNRFEFSFLSPRLVAESRLKSPVCPITFLNSISAMLNAISRVEDLNSSCWVHFLRG